ncbi:hypothetical protein DID80_01385 [Candidatus Marinamargulisbacteria bacterium SCGC AAA071-K20]|nr:hypothetical protein DID80_01385 [Candidatus Marinamargulisbacteria bacterium SCGC AAA071-K20]
MSCSKLKLLFTTWLALLFSSVLFASAPINIVTVTTDFASIAKSVGGDFVRVESFVKGSRDLHGIRPKPSMVLKLRKADLLIRLGMDQDSWVEGLIQTARKEEFFEGGIGYLDASVGIEKLEVPSMDIDGRQGDVHKEGNPHYWLAPSNGILIGRKIMEKLIVMDPKNAEVYKQNFLLFQKDLNSKVLVWKELLLPYKDYSFITYHKTWPYFFEEFGLSGLGQLESLPGIPPTTKHLHNLKLGIKKEEKPVVLLMANYYNQAVGRSFSNRIGARLVVVPINASHTTETSYFDLFDAIVKEIINND